MPAACWGTVSQTKEGQRDQKDLSWWAGALFMCPRCAPCQSSHGEHHSDDRPRATRARWACCRLERRDWAAMSEFAGGCSQDRRCVWPAPMCQSLRSRTTQRRSSPSLFSVRLTNSSSPSLRLYIDRPFEASIPSTKLQFHQIHCNGCRSHHPQDGHPHQGRPPCFPRSRSAARLHRYRLTSPSFCINCPSRTESIPS